MRVPEVFNKREPIKMGSLDYNYRALVLEGPYKTENNCLIICTLDRTFETGSWQFLSWQLEKC